MNEVGMELLKSFEELKLKSYQGKADVTGTFTIGYGHVITGHEEHTHGFDLFKPGQTIRQVEITQEQAESLLARDIEKTSFPIFLSGHATDLNDDQLSALQSLVFNIGGSAFLNQSTAAKLLNAGTISGIADAGFRGWVSSAGKKRRGLIIRRAAEKALFNSDYDKMKHFIARANDKTYKEAADYLGISLS